MSAMSPLERVIAAVSLEEPDIVPVGPYICNHCAKIANIPISRYCSDSKAMAEAKIRSWETYKQDIIVVVSDNYYIAEGFGLTVDMHEDTTPTIKKPAVNRLEEIYNLKVPNPCKDGRMPVYLEAITGIKKQLKDAAVIRGTGTGPFSLASHLLGTERFLMELAIASAEPDGDNAKALRYLMELTSDALIAFAKAQVEAGADMVQAGDSLASPDVISPETYKLWVYPYEKKFFSALNNYSKDKKVMTILHICGNTMPILPLMVDTGAMIMELDYKVDMASAKRIAGSKACLMGNLNPAGELLYGKPESVADEAKKCICDAAKGGGFILGSGCEVAPQTPVQNILAMVEVARQSRYPL